jgi:hypothetical protein
MVAYDGIHVYALSSDLDGAGELLQPGHTRLNRHHLASARTIELLDVWARIDKYTSRGIICDASDIAWLAKLCVRDCVWVCDGSCVELVVPLVEAVAAMEDVALWVTVAIWLMEEVGLPVDAPLAVAVTEPDTVWVALEDVALWVTVAIWLMEEVGLPVNRMYMASSSRSTGRGRWRTLLTSSISFLMSPMRSGSELHWPSVSSSA